MARTRVKICGITRLEDALTAIEAGADALGFVFYAPSPRSVEVKQAAEIIAQLPAFVTTTALFVNAEREFVDLVIRDARIDLLQFHGDEDEAFCNSFSRPYIKALRMKPELDLNAEVASFSSAQAILLDAYRPGMPGGTGEIFDWDRIPEQHPAPIILAGGLDSGNVAQAVAAVTPYAVDVSGGVEQSKGIKDANKINMFVNEVTRAN
ncbi:phosphoribosylanthranilate isomerase [Neptuniibacter caesariensis]|uniref:N-(5'-phosphoribosyl)anthranilate isomerase n=1 Tax=Neptuniibacter caesariensis TaxID=207954 RepID=A0A7U8C7Y5_NEPCE|nr:phosphoribosylanthranilate isomerase [Neptuniibacter caesariensis]EAR61760.1 N-(5'-phosphoribosyl) anthranilate isomerase [Neptuniibacter caesariensis]